MQNSSCTTAGTYGGVNEITGQLSNSIRGTIQHQKVFASTKYWDEMRAGEDGRVINMKWDSYEIRHLMVSSRAEQGGRGPVIGFFITSEQNTFAFLAPEDKLLCPLCAQSARKRTFRYRLMRISQLQSKLSQIYQRLYRYAL